MKNLYDINDWTGISAMRLGEILIEAGKINLLHLSMVLDMQKFKKMPIGEILLAMKVITEKDLKQALFIQDMIRKRCNNA